MNWYKKLTIGAKIWILSSFMILSLLGTELFSKYLVNTLGVKIGELTEVHLPAVRAQMTADMMHDGLTGVVYRGIVAGEDSNAEELALVEADLKDVTETFEKTLAEIEGYRISERSKKDLEQVKPVVKNYTDMAATVVGLVKSGKLTEAKQKLPEFQKAFESLEETLGTFGDNIQKGAEELGQEAIVFKNNATRMAVVVMVVSVILAFAMAWFLTRDIMARLKFVISGLKNEALQVSEASVSSKKDAESLSASSTEQSTAIQETAASLEEINAMLKRTSENAKNLNKSSQDSSESAAEGNKSVHHVLEAMNTIKSSNEDIRNQVDKSNNQITEIVGVISEIGNKTKVINDIVFQTKLLSFNASVEAARAGEHGKGFAVVAEEVGNLAQMSGNAAKEISDMLASSIAKVEHIVSETKRSVETLIADGKHKVDSGVETAKRCGESLNDIVRQVESVKVMVNDITTAISEQTQGINEISKAISQLDEATQMNSKLAEKTSTEAHRLVARSSSLTSLVGELEKVVTKTDSGAAKTDFYTAPQSPISTPKTNSKTVKISDFSKTKKADLVKTDTAANKTLSKQKVANGDEVESVPNADDPRFEDV